MSFFKKMKFPSVEILLSSILETLKRFPLVLLCSFVGTGIMIHSIHVGRDANEELAMKLVTAFALGIPLFTSLTLLSSTRSWSLITKILIQLAGIGLLVAYLFSLFHYQNDPKGYRLITRFFLLNIGLHFLVSFIPFIKQKNIKAFWQYNEFLFSRFLTSLFFSHVLFLGIAVCLASVDKLLGINIKEKIYFDSWVILLGVFNTWFFLGGIPKDFNVFNQELPYPKALKVFVQYILIPLIALYFIILYLYVLKIIITQTWPTGWVAWPIIIASLVGMLTLLLSFPIREDVNNRWVKIYSKYFNLALLPLIALLLVSIGRRISDYGITENRYFVLALGIWVGMIALYFALSRQKNIKVIPVSLCLIAFLSSFGPWSTFKVSEWSQVKRLEKILEKNQILVNGKIKIPDTLLADREASAIIEYLNKWHGFEKIQPWVDTEIPANAKSTAAELLGIDYLNKWATKPQKKFSYSSKSNRFHELNKSDVMLKFSTYKKEDDETYQIQNDFFHVDFDGDHFQLKLTVNNLPEVTFNLESLIKNLNSQYGNEYKYNIDPSEMALIQEDSNLWVHLLITSIGGNLDQGSMDRLTGNLLIKIKN